jgi:hypothetical protein
MQTFLPWPDFRASARDLDVQRLGKQRVETLQLLQSRLRYLQRQAYGGEFKNQIPGWYHHPARHMWHEHEPLLAVYGYAICDEWTARGYKDTCREQISLVLQAIVGFQDEINMPCHVVPAWFIDDRLFESHRAALLRKNPEHYASYKGTCDPELDYFWPTEDYPHIHCTDLFGADWHKGFTHQIGDLFEEVSKQVAEAS